MTKQKSLNYCENLLPSRITVEIHKEKEGGFWAKIKEFPHCYTQAESQPELVNMINEAVATYLEIPNKFRKKIGFYLPKKLIKIIEQEIYNHLWC